MTSQLAGAPSAPAAPDGLGAQGRFRVLHLITHLDHGGAQDNTLLTVAGIDRTHFQVDLAGGGGALVDRAGEVADRLIVLPAFRRRLLNPGDARTFAAFCSLVGSYDVVHTHGSKAGVLGRIAARARGVPAIVHTVHGFPVTPEMSGPKRRALLGAERMAARCTDRVICVCPSNAEEARQLRIARDKQLRVVVSGVPEDSVVAGDPGAVRRELGIPSTAPVLLTVTRMMPQKAPLDFVRAAVRMLADVPDAHALMAGDGPLLDEVTAAAAPFPQIHVLGRRADIPDLLAAADVVAFSSLWEGLGRALTEAVLAGKPVVATAVNGVPDLVLDGRTGYLVPPGDPGALASALTNVFRRPDRGAALGEAGAALVRGRYGVDQMVRGVEAVYWEVLTQKALARPAQTQQPLALRSTI